MSNKVEFLDLVKSLLENRSDLLKYPEEFGDILRYLRKATKEDEYGEGYSIVDNPDQDFEDDDAAKWLEENTKDNNAKQPDEQKQQEKKFMREWSPAQAYSPEQEKAIKEHMDNGYSHREAERLAGAFKGPSDFMSAMRSGIAPSMMSDKMLGDLKPLAKLWLEEADKKEKLSADPEVNPMKHAAGKLMEAHEKHTGNYNKAYSDFLASDDIKGLKGRDRHNAIQAWKLDWKSKNPEHDASLAQISNAQKHYGESKQAAKQSLQEKMSHIMMGGQSMPTEMSASEAMQHIGGGKTEEGYHGTIIQDPSSSFASRNPKLVAALKPEQQERLNRVNSAATSQGKVRIRKGGND